MMNLNNCRGWNSCLLWVHMGDSKLEAWSSNTKAVIVKSISLNLKYI